MKPIQIQKVGAVLAFGGIGLLTVAAVMSIVGDLTHWFDLDPFSDQIVWLVCGLMAAGTGILYIGTHVKKRYMVENRKEE
jgi:hypothetical protein